MNKQPNSTHKAMTFKDLKNSTEKMLKLQVGVKEAYFLSHVALADGKLSVRELRLKIGGDMANNNGTFQMLRKKGLIITSLTFWGEKKYILTNKALQLFA
jgi:hypothetical protein